jgi:hypothetical protein
MDGWTCSVLVGSGGTGALGAYPRGRPGAEVWWQDLGAPPYGTPAAAVSRTGQLTVAAVAPGRGLLVARRRPAPETLALGEWRPVTDENVPF